METVSNQKSEHVGTVALVLTFTFILAGIIAIISWLRPMTYEVTIVETGESFVITEPPVLGGDGFRSYEVRRSGEQAIYGISERREKSVSDTPEESGALCVWSAASSRPEEACLFYLDPKTRQAYLTRPE